MTKSLDSIEKGFGDVNISTIPENEKIPLTFPPNTQAPFHEGGGEEEEMKALRQALIKIEFEKWTFWRMPFQQKTTFSPKVVFLGTEYLKDNVDLGVDYWRQYTDMLSTQELYDLVRFIESMNVEGETNY